MTLTQHKGKWEMWTSNATVVAYGSGFMIPKVFASLEEVERVYKSWRGISVLHSRPMEKPNDRPSKVNIKNMFFMLTFLSRYSILIVYSREYNNKVKNLRRKTCLNHLK